MQCLLHWLAVWFDVTSCGGSRRQTNPMPCRWCLCSPASRSFAFDRQRARRTHLSVQQKRAPLLSLHTHLSPLSSLLFHRTALSGRTGPRAIHFKSLSLNKKEPRVGTNRCALRSAERQTGFSGNSTVWMRFFCPWIWFFFARYCCSVHYGGSFAAGLVRSYRAGVRGQ